MPDLDKVIRGLKCLSLLSLDGTCAGCAYFRPFADDPESGWCNRDEATKDALVLLMDQEPVVPFLNENHLYVTDMWKCGACEQRIFYKQRYCGNCGRAVKW